MKFECNNSPNPLTLQQVLERKGYFLSDNQKFILYVPNNPFSKTHYINNVNGPQEIEMGDCNLSSPNGWENHTYYPIKDIKLVITTGE